MKPVKTAFVRIWGNIVGAVAWQEEKNHAIFEFEPQFLKQGLDLSPVHMGLDRAIRGETKFAFPNLDWYTFNGLPGLLSCSLPDRWGNKIIDAWLTRMGRATSSFNPVERLCYVGTRGMGALEFVPQVNPRTLNQPVPVEIESLMELAQEVMSERTRVDVDISGSNREKADAIKDILRVGTSAGGAVPKAIIAMNNSGHVISGQSSKIPEGYSHWIIKFDGISEQSESLFGEPLSEGRVEYAYYLMAQAADINMEECRLLEENGRAHFLTKRFDRGDDGQKIHMQTLGAIAHFGWNPTGVHGYEHVFQIMRKIGLGKKDQEQQYRRMIFNAITRNTDDHIKNFSFLMDEKGTWGLSPAYDMTFSYNPDDILGSRHKLSINGKQKDFTMADFLALANAVEVRRPETIIEEVMAAVEHWPEYARAAEVNQDITRLIGEMHLIESVQESSPRPSIR